MWRKNDNGEYSVPKSWSKKYIVYNVYSYISSVFVATCRYAQMQCYRLKKIHYHHSINITYIFYFINIRVDKKENFFKLTTKYILSTNVTINTLLRIIVTTFKIYFQHYKLNTYNEHRRCHFIYIRKNITKI